VLDQVTVGNDDDDMIMVVSLTSEMGITVSPLPLPLPLLPFVRAPCDAFRTAGIGFSFWYEPPDVDADVDA
jgi:hypothetical protein